MNNKIIIAAWLGVLSGCAQTPVQPQTTKSPVEQYWINRNKAEAYQKAHPVKVIEPTPAEIARSQESDKADKECDYDVSKATVGMYENSSDDEIFNRVKKRVAEIELKKKCLAAKGF